MTKLTTKQQTDLQNGKQNKQVINFLFHQLALNEQDRERFNSISPNISVFQTTKSLNFEVLFTDNHLRARSKLSFRAENLHKQVDIVKIAIIRTCLSRVDDKAVLGVFDKNSNDKKTIIIKEENLEELAKNGFSVEMITKEDHFSLIVEPTNYTNKKCKNPIIERVIENQLDKLKHLFNCLLDNGKTLNTALSALHDKMLELMPEYQYFLNNNNNK